VIEVVGEWEIIIEVIEAVGVGGSGVHFVLDRGEGVGVVKGSPKKAFKI